MNKFIKLTKSTSGEIYIQSMLITAMEKLHPLNPFESKTAVHMMNGGCWYVMETVEEIQKLIADAEKITLTTWETGPR